MVAAPAPASTPAPTPVREELVPVAGNTYPVREKIRAMGGRWDGFTKVWMVPASKAAEVRAMVAAAPVETRSSKPRYSNWRPCGYPGCSPTYCDECNGEGYRPAGGGRRWRR